MSIVERPPVEPPSNVATFSLPELVAGAYPDVMSSVVEAYSSNYQAGYDIGCRLTTSWMKAQLAENERLTASQAELSLRLDLEPKTQLLHQVAFDRLAKEIITDPKSVEGRRKQGFALLFLDLDDFKAVNTALGEPEADRLCLLPTAEIIKRHTRRVSDLAGATESVIEVSAEPTEDDRTSQASRFGGEEFTILLAGVDKEDARVIAERIRSDINSIRYPDGIEERQLGVSIGISVFPLGADYEAVFQLANDAESHAKSFPGKNQIVVAPGYNQITLDALSN